MSANCVFCKIIADQAPAQRVYHDDWVTAFRDIHPVAPTHILIVTNRHLDSVNAVTPGDEATLGRLFTVARTLAEQEGIARAGYRLIVNTGPNAGQRVFHIHMHLLGGQPMRHPMG
jgi:histidine triad (HIT) family protein